MHKKTKQSHKSIADVSVKDKTVFVRCDFNCPEEDYFRIESALPTLQHILKQGPKRLILATHYGRPTNRQEYSTLVFKPLLEKYLNTTITFLPKGLDTLDMSIGEGIFLMENTRHHSYETKPEEGWEQMFQVDVFCNEAFSCSHRNHTSITNIQSAETCLGHCHIRELTMLDQFKYQAPDVRKMVILGGNKIDDKLPVLQHLVETVDIVFIAGNTLNHRDTYQEILANLSSKKAEVIYAEDGFGEQDGKQGVYLHDLSDGWVKDIGPKTLLTLSRLLDTVDMVFWNGTMGIVEAPAYRLGSEMLIHLLNKCRAQVIIGGGDTAGFVNKYKNQFLHISTGGGASIDYLRGSAPETPR